MNRKLKVAIIGPGNIGTDLMTVFSKIQEYFTNNTLPGPPPTFPFGSTLTTAETTFLTTQMQSFASAHSGLTCCASG